MKYCSDVAICKLLVNDYLPELGLRSLRKAVLDRVASLVDEEYMAVPEDIAEKLPVQDFVVFVSGGKIRVEKTTGLRSRYVTPQLK